MAGPIRIGILGAAKIAPLVIINRAHASSEFEITAVGARDSARAKAYADEHKIPHVAKDYQDLVTRSDVDLVYNALPQAAHKQWTIAALDAGKDVLCEKPFARNAGEAREMVAAAERNGRILIEAFHYRFHNVAKRAMEIVRSGELGRLIEAEAVFEGNQRYRPDELRWSPEQAGGALMDQGCYVIHGLRTIIGSEPHVISARCDMLHGVDAATEAKLQFTGGPHAKIFTTMTSNRFYTDFVLRGEKGKMRITNLYAPQIGSKFTVTINGEMRKEPTKGPSTYAAQFAHLSDVLLRGAKPITGGADAIANMAVIDAIYEKAGVR